MTKRILFLAVIWGLILSTQAQQSAQQLTFNTDYFLYLPEGYGADTEKEWPLLFFLHGAGERGSDLDKVKVHGPPKIVETKDLPFIVVSPQCPTGEWWNTFILNKLYDQVLEGYRVDKKRVYLTGLSMGGFGTWNWSTENPEKFAAIAPICGGGDAEKAWKIRHVPTWVFHGDADQVVPLQMSTSMVDALKLLGSDPKFTVYPGVGHDSWTESYDNPDLYTWFLSHEKSAPAPAKVDSEKLAAYTGTYLHPQFGEVEISLEAETLFALMRNGGPKQAMVPEGKNRFRIDIPMANMVEFKEKGMQYYSDRGIVEVPKKEE